MFIIQHRIIKPLIDSANFPGVLTGRNSSGVWGTALMKVKKTTLIEITF